MKKLILLISLGIIISSQTAFAANTRFTNEWKSLEFFRIPATKYAMKGQRVDITAKSSSSVIYHPLPKANWNNTRASWGWQTTQSVPPTDLSRKGVDDRNISLYFVFLDQKTAERIGQTASIKKLLTSKKARILIYTFGGDKPRNTFLTNPYLGKRGVTIIKRAAKPGSFSENVDLGADYRRAFGASPDALVGVALASDSDNTGKTVIARVENLQLQ